MQMHVDAHMQAHTDTHVYIHVFSAQSGLSQGWSWGWRWVYSNQARKNLSCLGTEFFSDGAFSSLCL